VSDADELRADLERLRRANEELRRVNQRLTREWLGRHDAAAATAAFHHEREVAALREELAARAARIEELTEVAKRNDDLYHQQLAWHDAPRYHAVDWLRGRLLALPGVGLASRAAWRVGVVIRRIRGRR
jgi:hypothetical protein